MANRWSAQPVRDDGDSGGVIRARRWLMALYMPFYCLGLFVGFMVFEAIAPESAITVFREVYHGREGFLSAWPLVICGLVMCFSGPLIGQFGSLLWLIFSKVHLRLAANEVLAV